MLTSVHVSVSVLVPSPCLCTACFTCMSCFLSLSLHVLLLLLSVLDDKAVPAVPEDDGKLSVGPVLIGPLAVRFCVCLLLACGCSRERGLSLLPATFRPPPPPAPHAGRPGRCTWSFECLFCAGLFHLHPDEAAAAAGPVGRPRRPLQLQTACRRKRGRFPAA